MSLESKWDAQVVYERQESYDMAAGPYGYEKVGVRFNDRVIWLGMRGYGVPERVAAEWDDVVRLAHLLAAAPDLYKVLVKWDRVLRHGVASLTDDEWDELAEDTWEALRKAQGESDGN